MSQPVELAGALQAMSDEQLDALIKYRRAPHGVTSYFDLADFLLSQASIDAALEPLGPAALSDLARGVSTASLDALGLGFEGRAFASVAARAIEVPAEPTADIACAEPVALESAVATTIDTGSLLEFVAARPLQLRTRGAVSMADLRRLAEALRLDVAVVSELVTIAETAGLLVRTGSQLLASTAVPGWTALPIAERWAYVREHWVAALPEHEVAWATLVPESLPVAAVAPCASQVTAARVTEVRALAHRLGLQANAPSVLATGSASTLAERMPASVTTAYVQPDLSIVVPGPLAPATERQLRLMADPEQRGIASTYRLSRASLSRALASGDDEASLLAFLTSLSITPLPQPVTYLVRDAASSFGSVRVRAVTDREHSESGAKTIVSAPSSALQQLAVDRAMSALNLFSDGHGRLASRVSPETVVDALLQARYPAVLETIDGHVILPSLQFAEPAGARHSPIVQRLRGAGFDVGASEQAWLERQLELATKDRSTVRVRLMVGAEERELSLIPLGVKGGRLRARDAASDVERTLPISAITFVSGTREASASR